MAINRSLFGTVDSGVEVTAYELSNDSAVSFKFIDLGGTIVSINAPDKNGNTADVVLGYNDPESYLKCGGYTGALIGRYGNRIGGAEFTLDGKTYKLYKNDGNNHLHGGKIGYDRKMWDVKIISEGNEPECELHYLSCDGEEGYDGNLDIHVFYKLTKDGAVSIRYTATTDKKTVVNLTNHSYFNLRGYDNGNILGHELTIAADSFSEVSSDLIPTGKAINVEGTEFDFRTPKTIGRDINGDNIQLKYGKGYDHNFILNGKGGVELCAVARDPESGRTMTVYTDQPCVQLYTGNCIDVTESPYKNGSPKRTFAGFCLETQHMPDSPNHPDFTDTTLSPGETYDYTTVFAFSAE